MEKLREYETIWIVQPEASEARAQEITDKIRAVVERDGTIFMVKDWGQKKLAYEISGHRKGRYTCMNFATSGTVLAELERNLHFDEDIIRFMTVKQADAVPDLDARKKEFEKMGAAKSAESEEAPAAAEPATEQPTA